MIKTGIQGVATIYIPNPVLGVRYRHIAPGSGIVGVATEHGGAVLHFEGNLYGAENLMTYEERVRQAAGRLFQRYPTVARLYLAYPELGEFLAVGAIDQEYRISYDDAECRARALAYGDACTNGARTARTSAQA